MTEILQARNCTKRYGAFTALDDVSLVIREGELLSIVGPNGAGKTTLVSLLTGQFAPTLGTILFRGQDMAGIGPGKLAQRGLARGFQLVQMFPLLTVAEAIAVAVVSQRGRAHRIWSSLRADRAVTQDVEEVATIFGLTHRLDTRAGLLSQGEKKLLDIASAFALKPQVILLDEPTSGVATADKHTIMRTLIAAAERIGLKGIILVEHDMDLVAAYSDRIVALQGGRVLADLPKNEFFRNAEVVAAVVGRPPAGFH